MKILRLILLAGVVGFAGGAAMNPELSLALQRVAPGGVSLSALVRLPLAAPEAQAVRHYLPIPDGGLGSGLVARALQPRPAPAAVAAPVVAPVPPAVDTGFDTMTADLAHLAQQQGGRVAIALREMAGPNPQSFSYDGEDQFVAASTYKLPVLAAEAEGVAAGTLDPNGLICYQDADWEDGPYADYADGVCLSREELAQRVGISSDNTAAHMLVRDLGGTAALDAYAQSRGATNSQFFDPNLTTADDLAAIWAASLAGPNSSGAAQGWLFPLLTHTAFESGIPAGLPAQATAVHKIGAVDGYIHDAAAVTGAPAGPYVLVVMTEGVPDGWALAAQVSARVWTYEASRPAA
ncbi:MAG: serine hydrolase [Candidatus Dormibacteria bacterium]